MRVVYLCNSCSVKHQKRVVLSKFRAYLHANLLFHRVYRMHGILIYELGLV